MDARLLQFFKMVFRNWLPLPLRDERAYMHESTRFVVDALVAMAED